MTMGQEDEDLEGTARMATRTVVCGKTLNDGRTCRRKHQPGRPCGAKHRVVIGEGTVAPQIATFGGDAKRVRAFHRLVALTDPITGRVARPIRIYPSGPFRRLYDGIRERAGR